MIDWLAPLFTATAAFGLGGSCLRLLGLHDRLSPLLRLGVAWACGFGLLGWLMFPLALVGWVAPWQIAVVLLISSLGCFWLWPLPRCERLDIWAWVVLAVLMAALIFDLAEALAPPADADSLAYHFLRPKEILAAKAIAAVARAVDGATPLLVQMTYVPALALGGERGLTLWAGLSGWLSLLPLFALARLWLPINWSLALTGLVATTPAWVYGAGSGQVEVRLAAFATVAGFALARCVQDRSNRQVYAVLAGLLAGVYAGSKFFGLPFAAICVLLLLLLLRLQQGWRPALMLALVSALAGGQWYIFHWIMLGDPLFPMLWPYLGVNGLWDQAHHLAFRVGHYESETAVPRSLFWLVAYPFVATFSPYPIWEAARTGLGIAPVMLLPFAMAGGWRQRHGIGQSPLAIMALLIAGFYVVWFFSGTSQRIRHLLPILPILLLILTVAAHRWAQFSKSRAIVIVLATVLTVQLAGHAVFASGYIRSLISHESRAEFLRRNVINYDAAIMVNGEIDNNSKVLIGERQLLYFLDRPYFFGQILFQAQIDLLPDSEKSVPLLLKSMIDLGITHILIEPGLDEPTPANGLWRAAARLVEAGCAHRVQSVTGRVFASRTLGLGAGESHFDLLLLRSDCVEARR